MDVQAALNRKAAGSTPATRTNGEQSDWFGRDALNIEGAGSIPASPSRILAWLRKHNARVRFQSDDTVSVTVNRTARRRTTLALAVAAVDGALGAAR